jgi:hypothetical protein
MKGIIAYSAATWVCMIMVVAGPPNVRLAGLLLTLFMNAVIIVVAMWMSLDGRRPPPPPNHRERRFARRRARAARRAAVILDKDPNPK